MSQAATYIRNGVHPRRIVELYMGEPEPGSGELAAAWGNKPPPDSGGFIDTRPPPGGRPFREANVTLLHGQNLPVWIAYVASGPRVTLLYAIKHPDRKPEVEEMDRRAAKLVTSRFPALRQHRPTMVVAMPSGSWHAGHFAEEVAKAANLPLKTGVFNKTGAIKGVHFSEKMHWARTNIQFAKPDMDFEGQSVALADDNFGSGASMSAAAELLYDRGASYVIGVATFRIKGVKDPEAEDVSLGFAKAVTEPETDLDPEIDLDPEADSDSDLAPKEKVTDQSENRNLRNGPRAKGKLLRRAFTDNRDSLPAFTVKDLADVYDAKPVEVRFTLSQLGLAKDVKPG